MSDSPTLLSLAAKVESLTGPCRETGDEVLLACGWQIEDWGEGPARSRGWINPDPDGEDYLDGDHPNPTASLDAAMTLVPNNGRLLELGQWQEHGKAGRWFAQVTIWHRTGENEWLDKGYAVGVEKPDEALATAPLALVAASLRARSALEASHG